jgi:HTH-type transcriptional regulator/antitoxin HigA
MNKPFTPDWISKPGDTILYTMEERGITISQLTECGYSDIEVMLIINGDKPITDYFAKHLSIVIGGTPEFWLRRQERYDSDFKQLEQSQLTTNVIHIAEVIIDIGIPSLFVYTLLRYIFVHDKVCTVNAINIMPIVLILCGVIYLVKQISYTNKM